MGDDLFTEYEPDRPWEEISVIARVQRPAKAGDPRPVFRLIPDSEGQSI